MVKDKDCKWIKSLDRMNETFKVSRVESLFYICQSEDGWELYPNKKNFLDGEVRDPVKTSQLETYFEFDETQGKPNKYILDKPAKVEMTSDNEGRLIKLGLIFKYRE